MMGVLSARELKGVWSVKELRYVVLGLYIVKNYAEPKRADGRIHLYTGAECRAILLSLDFMGCSAWENKTEPAL